MFALLLLTVGAEPIPTFTVENRIPASPPSFVVVNRVPEPSPVIVPPVDTPRREFWAGYGWVEWRNGGWWKVETQPQTAQPVAVPGVAAPNPFPDRSSTPATLAPSAGARSTARVAPVPPAGVITTLAPPGIRGGTINCSPFG